MTQGKTCELVAGVARLTRIAGIAAIAAFGGVTFLAETPAAQIRVETQVVLVEATVKDRAGRVAGDLKKEDFVVLDDGVVQQISHFSRDQMPLAVALVVDLSGSIEPFLRPLRYATLTALKTLRAEDQVALFLFTSDVERRVDLTRDKREVSDQLEELSAQGGTNINAAVYEAARYLEDEAPAARRVVILVSDNVPIESGGYRAQEVAEAVLAADAALYGLKVPGRNPVGAKLAGRLRGGDLVNVSKLAAETGGEVFDVEKEGSLFLAFQQLITRLKTRYTLGYYPARAGDGKFHKLEVTVSGHSVLAKRGYYSRATAAAAGR